MSLPDGLRFRDATLEDLPAIAQLREAVGWAAHEWALRLAIEPDNARFFVVVDDAGVVAATGSGVAYGRIGFVGNMIVAEGHRRRGIGAAVLRAVIGHLEAAGCTRLELYATEQGRPLYARHGFEFIAPGSHARLPRNVPLQPPTDVTVTIGGPEDLDELTAFDQARFGGPRRAILETVLGDRAFPALIARRNGRIAGYGWLRVDGERIGPWVADDPGVASAILDEAFRHVPRASELTANVPMSNDVGLAWLRSLGVEPDPWDGRMARGAPLPRREDTLYGNVVGALG